MTGTGKMSVEKTKTKSLICLVVQDILLYYFFNTSLKRRKLVQFQSDPKQYDEK